MLSDRRHFYALRFHFLYLPVPAFSVWNRKAPDPAQPTMHGIHIRSCCPQCFLFSIKVNGGLIKLAHISKFLRGIFRRLFGYNHQKGPLGLYRSLCRNSPDAILPAFFAILISDNTLSLFKSFNLLFQALICLLRHLHLQ